MENPSHYGTETKKAEQSAVDAQTEAERDVYLKIARNWRKLNCWRNTAKPRPRHCMRQMRLMLTELARLQDQIIARNPEEAPPSIHRADMLPYLMTATERQLWDQLTALIAEMRRLI